MFYKTHSDSLTKAITHRNMSLVFGFGMLIANLILSSIVAFKDEKIHLIPPEINKPMWISGSHFSKSYLEGTALYLIEYLLDVDVTSASLQRDIVLQHVTPEAHNGLLTRLIEEEKRMNESMLSTGFRPTDIYVDEDNLKAIISGLQIQYIANQHVGQKEVTYQMQFTHKKGLLLLDKFEKIKGEDENND